MLLDGNLSTVGTVVREPDRRIRLVTKYKVKFLPDDKEVEVAVKVPGPARKANMKQCRKSTGGQVVPGARQD